MSTNSTSPIIPSNSSLAADDSYDHPVNEADEIVHRHKYFCAVDGDTGGRFDDCERNSASLWHDLDRDGVNTPAIPSFILNSPPMGPLLSGGSGGEYEDMMLHVGNGHADVAIHSLRKGICTACGIVDC